MNRPKGPNGSWKTGQRVPETRHYEDQYGVVTRHEMGKTFPPCVDRKGECAYRVPSRATGEETASA
ncbi:hypothetical protein [Streptacidiphilus carbonis]|uniref:hypothetical protein n=1 Tax=Streptacidiphilus carbonis TaxID=105422 RepID=UPI00126A1961|nr:hypothetical protein [Streptacidiphilus carbonis]